MHDVSATLFVELVEAYLRNLSIRKPSPHTTAAYRADLLGIGTRAAAQRGTELELLTLADLDKSTLRLAFASWSDDHAAASIRRAWSVWRGLFDHLVSEDYLEGSPMAAITPPKLPAQRAKVIQHENLASTLLRTAAQPDETGRHPWPRRDVALIATFLVTGLRLSEVVGLTIGSFEGPEGARRLVVTGKGGKTRTVPVEAAYVALVERYLAERASRFPAHRLDHPATPLFVRADTGTAPSRQQVQHWVEKLYRRAGVRAKVPVGALVHALRHTFATSALDHGTDVVELQELLGHSSLETTRRYLQATGAQLRHAVANHPAQHALKAFESDQEPAEI